MERKNTFTVRTTAKDVEVTDEVSLIPPDNQRRTVRIPIQLRAQIEDDMCTIVNLSLGGCQVMSTKPLTSVQTGEGDTMIIRFVIGSSFAFGIRLVWQDKIGNGFRYGFSFIEAASTEAERLEWILIRLAVRRRRLHRPLP